MTSYFMTPVIEPSSFWWVILSYAYSLQYHIYWWIDTFFFEWPFPWYWLYLGSLFAILIGIIIYSVIYSILYFFFSKKIPQSSLSKKLKYNNWINIFIRLIPLGYIITSIHSISSWKSFKVGLLYEVIYTISTGIIYFIGYTIYYYYFL